MALTVVIPCFNAARWIRETLDSVLSQPLSAAEVIVVDDGSSDASAAIVEEYGDSVTLFRQANGGACKARNVGLAHAGTTHVMFLDADDYLEGDFLGGAVRALERANADIAFAPLSLETPDGGRKRIFHYATLPSPAEVFGGWLNHFSQPPCSIVWRAEFVRSIGGWDERVLKNQDGEIMMRAMLHGPVLTSFSEGQGVYRVHGENSLSRQRSSAALRSEYQAISRLMDSALQTPFRADVSGFGAKLYILARDLFANGEWESGRQALSDARRVGLRGHLGSTRHRLVASLVGLELKTRLARLLR